MNTKTPTMTDDQYSKIGQSCREAVEGNLLVGSFAAELVGEGYPFSKRMCAAVFSSYTDIELGRKFTTWIRETGQ